MGTEGLGTLTLTVLPQLMYFTTNWTFTFPEVYEPTVSMGR